MERLIEQLPGLDVGRVWLRLIEQLPGRDVGDLREYFTLDDEGLADVFAFEVGVEFAERTGRREGPVWEELLGLLAYVELLLFIVSTLME